MNTILFPKYKFNRMFLSVLSIMAIMAMASPNASALEGDPAGTDVGIVMPLRNERWLRDAAELGNDLQAAGVEYEILFSEGDAATELSNVETLISHGIQVLIIGPVDTNATDAVEAARDAGVKVISYDRLIQDTDAVDFYVTFDGIEVGRAQGQYIIDHAQGTGNPLYLYAGASWDNNSFLLFEGAWEVLQPKIDDGTFVIKNSSEAVALQGKPELTRDEQETIFSQITTNWSYDEAMSLAAANLAAVTAADKGHVFILAPNDETARGISDTYSADPDITSFILTGQDADKESIQYIMYGKQSMTVFKDVRTLASDAVDTAVTFLQGGTPTSDKTYNNGRIDVPAHASSVVVVDRSNIRSALIDTGYYQSSEFIWHDNFQGSFTEGWYWVNENDEKWNLTEQPGFLRIYVSDSGTGSDNLLLRPVAAGDFMIKTRLLFEPDTNFQFAGLVIWQDEYNFLQLGRAFCDIEGSCVGNGLYFDHIGAGEFVDGNFATSIGNPSEVYLRLERRGDMIRAFYSADNGISWYEIGTHWIPSDFRINGVGLTASQDRNPRDQDIPADFDFFELTEGRGFLPEGFHDSEQGDVPSWACYANGWATDPDDRTADVNVEIVVDDQTVVTLPAGDFRQDLADANVCVDGNCSFSAGLWDLISSYEPHRVDAWAQDDTGEWVLLRNSAKTLTCRTYDIYTYDPTTGLTKEVTNLRDMHEFNPRWSPDAKMIAHDSWSTDWSSHGVYITNVQTGASTPLAGGEGGSYPTWSPNGRWIAFDRGADNDYRLFIVSATGGNPRLVREDAFMASWAPNSQRLAFHQPSDGSIRTANLNGANVVMVVPQGNGPAWSPDGKWIAYEVDGDVWKVQVNNNGTPLGDPIQLTSSPAWEGRPTWSYDNKTIAFHAGMGQDSDIWTIPAAGGIPTWLTGAPIFGDYDANYSLKGQSKLLSYSSFSPDGQAPRQWGAAFSYDVGTWSEGDHTYHLESTYSVPESGGEMLPTIPFNVSADAPIHNGYVLLRGLALRARVGSGCPAIESVITPQQNTRFHYGWMTTTPMTYAEALAHFDSMAVTAYWDEGMSAELQRREIFSQSSVNWDEYVCAATETPVEPVLYIHYEYPDVVEGDYELGHTVEVTVFDSEWTIKATATVETMEMPHWGGAPGFRVEQWDGMEGPPDIQPGDVVRAVVDGGALSVETRVGEITAVIDLDANSITGTINAPWAGALVNVLCMPWGAPSGAVEKEATVAPDGVSEFTCTWDPSEWDIQPGESAGVSYWGNNLHWVANAAPNPWIMAFPEANQVFGYGWPTGSEVKLAINDEYIATTLVQGAPWDQNDIMAFFDFGSMHDLVAGDVVKLSGSGMERTHTVQNLAVTGVNTQPDTVSGTADIGSRVHAWVHEFGRDLQIDVTDGVWVAYFGGDDFHLQPGMCGRAEIRVEGNNSTNVDWCMPPPPRIVTQITDDWFRAENFTPNVQLTFWIYDGQGGAVLRHPETTWQLDGFGNTTVSMWELEEFIDLVPGHYLVVSDGTFTRELVLEAFTFDVFDTTTGHLAGTAPEPFERSVWAGIGVQDTAWSMDVTTDLSGNWSADFNSPIPTDYQWVAAQIFDTDGDASEIRPASQIIFLRPRCGMTYTVQPNVPLELRYGSWLALGPDLAAQNAEHLTVDLLIDDQPVSGVQQAVVPGSQIPCGAPEDAYGVFYVAQIGPLSSGVHTASATWTLDADVTDGYDSDGDGEPDRYGPGVVATHEFSIVVE